MSQEEFRNTKHKLTKTQKTQFYVSLCAKQPPAACRLSRKKLKYRKRKARLREEGDRMLNFIDNEKEIPTVEDLLNSPLARFIKLAANDCGYGGTIQK